MTEERKEQLIQKAINKGLCREDAKLVFNKAFILLINFIFFVMINNKYIRKLIFPFKFEYIVLLILILLISISLTLLFALINTNLYLKLFSLLNKE